MQRCEPEFIGKTFNDFLFRPQYSKIKSRSEVYIQNNISYGLPLTWPVISANMDTVTDDGIAVEMYKNGGLGIIHRNCSIEEQVEMVKRAKEKEIVVGAAIGVTGDFKERFSALCDVYSDIIVIDIAHGHSSNMRKAVEELVSLHTYYKPTMIGGNVATYEGAHFLAELGFNIIKVGIGPGSACTTRLTTSVGIPQLQAIREVWTALQSYSNVSIIADGGIKEDKDIFLALACGADAIMTGSMIFGTTNVRDKFNGYYRGMASSKARQVLEPGKVVPAPEGTEFVHIPHEYVHLSSIKDVADRIKGHLASSLSYAGVESIKELHQLITPNILNYLVPLSESSKMESFTRHGH